MKTAGINEDAFNIEIPRAQPIQRKLEDVDQEQELLTNKKAFSSGGIFLHTNHLVFNLSTIIEVQLQTLDGIEAKKKEVEEGKEAKKATKKSYEG